MVICCAAFNCSIRFSKDGIRFHKFPLKNEELCKRWILATRLESLVVNEHTVICEKHFKPSDYNNPFDPKSKLKEDSIPSIFIFPEHLMPSTSSKRKPPTERLPLQKKAKTDVFEKSEEDKLKEKLLTSRKQIRNLHQQIRRKNKKIESLSEIITDLKERSLISADVSEVLEQSFSGLSSEIIKNHYSNIGKESRGFRHNEEVKKFAVSLHYFSPAAYDYVRSIFCLPNPRSVSNWTSSVKCNPGIFIDVFNHLQSLIDEHPQYRDCALLCDAMSIKASTMFNKGKGCFEGFIDYGKDIIVDDENKIATEALVFMLVGLNGHWKYPVGYIFCDKINAENLKCLLSIILKETRNHNMFVHSITMDGTTTNINAMKLLGCKITNSDELNESFSFDGYDYELVFIMDPCHMLKLARNALGDLKVFIDSENRKIKWEHLQKLHEIQENEGLNFANKLSRTHILFHKQKMKVNIAAQTFSSSVADALEFLMKAGHPSFIDAEGTIVFIRTIDKLFDILNSRSPFAKGYKQPIRLSNYDYIKRSIDETILYLQSLSASSGQSLVNHRRKTFLVGFILAAKGILRVSYRLLKQTENPFKYVLSYKCSQDHIELLFAAIRGRNGFNNNPNVQQFKSSLRSILLRVSLIGSKQGNCLSFEEPAQNSLFTLKWTKNRTPFEEKDESFNDEMVLKAIDYVEDHVITPYKKAIIGYIGGYIVRSMLKEIHCEICANALKQQEQRNIGKIQFNSLISVKNRGGLVIPAENVCKVIEVAEKFFRCFVSGTKIQNISSDKKVFLKLRHAILNELFQRKLFIELNEHDKEHGLLFGDLHSSQVIKVIVNKYLQMRCYRYAQQFTKNTIQKGKLGLRQVTNKLILFKGL